MLVTCPSCGKRISDRAPVCPFCQAAQGVRPGPPPTPTPAAALFPLGPPPGPGETIGERFRVVRLLGEGAFGRTYLVDAPGAGSVYALKTPRDELLTDPRTRELFRREAQSWVERERHPWLVRAFHAGEFLRRLFVAMEYVAPGEDGLNSLEGFLRESPPDLAQSLRWAVQFCRAMEHAYARGLRCHRDIQPANILIGPDRAVRVSDPGIAGLPPTAEGGGFGTPTHMSPEQFTDAARCDERSDVYSFGVVLYQMAAEGRLPFPPPAPAPEAEGASRTWVEMERLHREASRPPLDSPLAPVVARCLEKAPARRYPSFVELRGDLEALLLHETDEVLRLPSRTETEAWELSNKGRGLMGLGRPQEALACFEGALSRHPLATAIHADKGRALEALGRLEEARRSFERAADLDPGRAVPGADRGHGLPAPGLDASPPPATPAVARVAGRALIEGRYEVYRVLGEGGFGVVRLVYDHETKAACALKTFREEYWADRHARESFERDARLWAGLAPHPYLVRARSVGEIAGGPAVLMDYVAPAEPGLGSLEAYLARRPPSLVQSLRWGIQLCHGLEHANAGGIRCHRNVKPANILIGRDRAARLSDFGLAGARPGPGREPGSVLPADPNRPDTIFGTPTHMPPERFSSADDDVRGDVYSLGVALYQMASGGSLPFLALVELGDPPERALRLWQEMARLHAEAPLPPLDSPLFPVIRRCLEKDPGRRFRDFADLRGDLAALLEREAEERLAPPAREALPAREWVDRGLGLADLERYEEAVASFDRATTFDPGNALAWSGRGGALARQGRRDEALASYGEALARDPRLSAAWRGKGACLTDLGRTEEALASFDQSLALDPDSPAAWNGKAACLERAGRHREALGCLQESIALDPGRAGTWSSRARCLEALGDREGARAAREKARALELRSRPAPAPAVAAPAPAPVPAEATPAPAPAAPEAAPAAEPAAGPAAGPAAPEDVAARGIEALRGGRAEEALAWFDRALEAEPDRAEVWAHRASSLNALGRWPEAAASADRALAKEPRRPGAWLDRGLALGRLERYLEALQCLEQAVALDPGLDPAWCLMGRAFSALGQEAEAVASYTRALEANPGLASAWCEQAGGLYRLNRFEESIACSDRALALEPGHPTALDTRGLALVALGRLEEALLAFAQALAADPRSPLVLFNKACTEDRLARSAEAARSFQEFLAVAPPHLASRVQHARARLSALGTA